MGMEWDSWSKLASQSRQLRVQQDTLLSKYSRETPSINIWPLCVHTCMCTCTHIRITHPRHNQKEINTPPSSTRNWLIREPERHFKKIFSCNSPCLKMLSFTWHSKHVPGIQKQDTELKCSHAESQLVFLFGIFYLKLRYAFFFFFKFQHPGNNDWQISVSTSPASSTQPVLGQPRLDSETLFQKPKTPFLVAGTRQTSQHSNMEGGEFPPPRKI